MLWSFWSWSQDPESIIECEKGFCLAGPTAGQILCFSVFLSGLLLQGFAVVDRQARKRWKLFTLTACGLVILSIAACRMTFPS